MYPIHKRTESGPEIAFYYLFKFQWLVLKLQLFKCFIFEHISFSTGPTRNRFDYMRLRVRLWLT